VHKKTWFITGASAGFGRILTEQLLAAGHLVAATARKPETLSDLSEKFPGQIITPHLDVTNTDSIRGAFNQTLNSFNHIDVLINNAGYGHVGVIEEVNDQEVRDQFEVNVFGLLNVTRPILAHMRERRSGTILNISSIAGLTSGATFPIYCASKHAVEAISEGLHASVKDFGVRSILIEPGAFRTRFADQASLRTSENKIADYKPMIDDTFQWIKDITGQQEGDPEKACAAMINVALEENPPLRLLLGEDAWIRANDKLNQLKSDFDRNETVTRSMAYDN
jgi:NADP-dependent 3-hydroxy acid dehydrogenase YdfG